MEQGYIKLYRSLDTHELLQRDNTSLVVFIKLLLTANWKTGEVTIGRNRLAAACNMKPSTVYSALKRLQKATVIQMQSNSTSTRIYICNWSKYQQSGKQSVTDSSTDIVTIKRTKKKNKNNIKEIKKEKNNSEVELDSYRQTLNFWSEKANRQLSDSTASKTAYRKLLKAHSVEEIQYAILGAIYFQGKPYKPQVMSFAALHDKWDALIGHMQNEKKKEEGHADNRF